MTRLLYVAVAVLAMTGCGPQQSGEPQPTETDAPVLKSGITLENMDTGIHPGDDFFNYVNGGWLASAVIPPDRSSYGGFGILSDEAQEDVRAIIEASANGDFPAGSDEQKVGDLYRSFMDVETRNTKGLAPLEPELERISSIADYDELAVYFAGAVKRGFDMPFSLGQYADMKNPEYYMIYSWQGGLGLPDREYYFAQDDKSGEIRDRYVAHIATMFDLAGFADGAGAAAKIMALETRMADAHMRKEDTRNFAANYTKFPLDELDELMPEFNWPGYINAMAIDDLDGLVVLMQDHMAALDTIIVDTELDTWKTYLQWVALNTMAGRLTEALDKQNFEFYGKILSGTEEQRPLWRRGVNVVNGTIGELVGKVYVREHFPPEAKERMLVLVGNLIRAYEHSIRELDWMTEATKVEALDKLSKFRPKIGYPDEWREYDFEIVADDLYGNLERASMAEYERLLDRQGGPVDRNEWAMTPQTVNAYYNAQFNEIVFPAAILQPPFFDPAADPAVNYGGIGAVIGHEMGHGFDDQGSKSDGKGIQRNWWTDGDRANFDVKTDALAAQYSRFEPIEGNFVDGRFTLGENIGDLGGLSMAYHAYKLSLGGKPAPVIDGFTGDQRFFLAWAQVWKRKSRDAALISQLKSDPHSPAEYRVNGVVRNMDEWYEAFGVTEGDALYLPPEERISIW